MSMLGEVVFCVDCDRARPSPPQAVPAGPAQAPVEPPRRMAVKRDANGDPLCAPCLDARQAKRRAEFLLHQGRAPLPEPQAPQPPSAAPAPGPRKKIELVRIVRSGGHEANVARATRKRRVPEKRKARTAPPQARTAPPQPKPANARPANARAVERQFVMLAVELGFLRAQRLLDQLNTATRRAGRSGARAGARRRGVAAYARAVR